MMALQSERYTTDLEYRDATDAALAVERDDRISWQELYEKTNDQLAAAVEALKMIEFDDDGVPQAWPKKDTIDAALAKIGENHE